MNIQLPTTNFRHYINGVLEQGEGERNTVICPGNEEKIASYPAATAAQAQRALEAARDAFPIWSAMPLEKRGEWMLKLADAIVQRAEDLVSLLIAESGKLRSHAAFEPNSLVNYLKFFLEQAKCSNNEMVRDISGGHGVNLLIREPVGVVFAALAWNFPLHNLATKLGPILASGCTAVIKPASKTPLSTLFFGEILDEISFPKGVINIVAGDAREIGEALNSSQIPAMLTMIGSTDAGLKMIRESATSIKRFSMELGGNAPVIITKNANLEAAAKHCIDNKMRCAGQTCISPQRAFVQEDVYTQVLDLMKKEAATAKCATLDEDGNTGPLISSAARDRMEELVKEAVARGAKLLCGGKRPDDREKGWFYLPTVLIDVPSDARVCREEVFGPILTVAPYKTLEDAISRANDSQYGLASYIWSCDLNEVNQVARGLQFGIANVNGPITGPALPHGGCKDSGIGKDGGKISLEEYTYVKCVRIATP